MFLLVCIFAGALPIDIKSLSPRVQQMHQQLTGFMNEHVYPNEAEFNRHQSSEHCWTPHQLLEKIKVRRGNHMISSLLSLKDTYLKGWLLRHCHGSLTKCLVIWSSNATPKLGTTYFSSCGSYNKFHNSKITNLLTSE